MTNTTLKITSVAKLDSRATHIAALIAAALASK
jgi:hypothetical protein